MPDHATASASAAGVVDVARELTVATAAGKVTYAGVGSIGYGWLFSNEFAVAAGFLIGVAGFLVNLYYRRRADRRQEALHAALMERARAGLPVDIDRDEADE